MNLNIIMKLKRAPSSLSVKTMELFFAQLCSRAEIANRSRRETEAGRKHLLEIVLAFELQKHVEKSGSGTEAGFRQLKLIIDNFQPVGNTQLIQILKHFFK